jgi:hypothetical protein
MAESNNFLIGYGERLASDMAAPVAGAPKKHPYTFAEARQRLAPKVRDTLNRWMNYRTRSARTTKRSRW